MNKKLTLVLIIMLALICLISGGVFAAPQSSPNVSPISGNLKDWTYTGTKVISSMRGSTGAMGNTGSLDVHLQRNTEYGAMLILGLSDYGKQASSVSYNNLFSDTKNGLATTTGNASGIYQVGANYEHVAAGKSDRTASYYLYYISSVNRDEYTTSINSSQKRGDAMNLFGTATATSSNWIRITNQYGVTGRESEYYYYGLKRYGFSWNVDKTYDYTQKEDSRYDYGKNTASESARAVVTQYN